MPWSSNIPKCYKRNAINGDLHRAKRIATDFDNEIVQIKEKFLAANFPPRFINSVCNDFLNKDIITRTLILSYHQVSLMLNFQLF